MPESLGNWCRIWTSHINFIFSTSGTISLDVRTSAYDGLLFYAADENKRDRVFAFLKDGYVVFGFDYGAGPVLITSNVQINDGEWHEVSFLCAPQSKNAVSAF